MKNTNFNIFFTSMSIINFEIYIFRQQAQHHLQIRNQNITKARECINKGMVSAASYYSQIAGLHAKKHDYANNLAASRLLQVYNYIFYLYYLPVDFSTSQNHLFQVSTSNTDNFTLDLHHLYVPEALQVLDLFLDKHISELKDSDRNSYMTKLFLITGRGRHSPGGQARIKPAVKKRLMERGIQYVENTKY